MPAVLACLQVLWHKGIVVVGCSSGFGRAPTVAEYVQEHAQRPYVAHCTVTHMTPAVVALLVASCIDSRSYGRDFHALQLSEMRPLLCLGWDWIGWNGMNAECVPRGTMFEAITPSEWYEGTVDVAYKCKGKIKTTTIDLRWFIPQDVIRSRHAPGRTPHEAQIMPRYCVLEETWHCIQGIHPQGPIGGTQNAAGNCKHEV